MKWLKQRLVQAGQHVTRAVIAPIVREQLKGLSAELLAHHYLAPLSGRFVPGTTAAFRPSGIVAILNDICLNHRKHVVECGGGVSTVYIARLLAQRGDGRLTTIEDDAAWARELAAILDDEGIGHTTTIIHAPMAPSKYAMQGRQWYDKTELDRHFNGQPPVDLLFVDGPGIGDDRYPAASYFQPRLASDFGVIMDDVPRGGRAHLPAWESTLRVKFRVIGDFAIASTNAGFKVFVAPT